MSKKTLVLFYYSPQVDFGMIFRIIEHRFLIAPAASIGTFTVVCLKALLVFERGDFGACDTGVM